MRDENFLVICGWMRNRLGLSGNELLVYALIFGFTQNGEDWYSGSLSYIADTIGATKRTAISVLSSLEEKGLVLKDQYMVQNVTFNRYRAVCTGFIGGEKISSECGEKFSPNNIKKENISPLNTKVFCPPTVDEVRSYVAEKGITNVDPEQFVDYYQSNGWKVGRTKMQDWKAAVRTWTRNRTSNSGNNRNVRNNHTSSNAEIDAWIKSLKDNPDYKGGPDVTNLL